MPMRLIAALPMMVLTLVAQQPAAKQSPPNPTNLKVLKAANGAEVSQIMRTFTVGLGVQCTYCHMAGDYASDEKPQKIAARKMIAMMQKINTFNDFIDCADYLVKNRYTSSNKLVIQGGSAGGLLMGAVTNMRPDLFKAVVAQVPFVDVMNTMLDATLPLTTSEYTEWGNPNEKPAFDYMIKYSPYDNIKAQNYPAILVQISLNDSQVPYWEGAKFAAKLRVKKTDSNPLLLRTNMGAGHGGSSGRYDALRETAFSYAFMLWQMGLVSSSAGTSPQR